MFLVRTYFDMVVAICQMYHAAKENIKIHKLVDIVKGLCSPITQGAFNKI